MQLFNRTPFKAGIFVDMDHTGRQTLALALKATYDFPRGEGDEPLLSQMQRSLAYADVFSGEPGMSSLLYESDANWGRTGSDVAFVGYAYPPGDMGRETDVMLNVGSLTKAAHVFGDRSWSTHLGVARLSNPAEFDRMPLVYERAFGGVDHSAGRPEDVEAEVRNPVGCGMKARKSRKAVEDIRPPNIEDPRQLIRSVDDRPAPVGFSFVAKGWQPRAGFAGTYDAGWQANRMPLLPEDFDPRFYRAASDGLCSESYLQGHEEISLFNLTPGRRERFLLPAVQLQAAFAVDAKVSAIAMHLDALLIDAVHSKLVMVWHGSTSVEGVVDDISWVMAETGPGMAGVHSA